MPILHPRFLYLQHTTTHVYTVNHATLNSFKKYSLLLQFVKILLVECLIQRIKRQCARLDEFSLGQTHPHKSTTPRLGSSLLTWRCDSTQFSRSSDPVPALLSICFRLVFVCTLQLYRYIPCCAPARPLSRHSIAAQRGENAPYYPLYTNQPTGSCALYK